MESFDWITQLSPSTWVLFSVVTSAVALLWAVGEDR